MQEEWREISGFAGREVSSLGNVRSWLVKGSACGRRMAEPRPLKACDNGHGYLCVKMRKDGKMYTFYVHRLVAEAFIPNPQKLAEINHLNEMKTDNRVENLAWISHEDNCRYGTRNQRLSAYRGDRCAAFGRHLTEETKQKLREINTGRTLSEEARRKISIAATGRVGSMKGRHHTEEAKRRMSDAHKGLIDGNKNPMYGRNAYAGKSSEELAAIAEKKRMTQRKRCEQKGV